MYGIDFYPTKPETIEKLLGDIDFRTINTMLEPNVGDGAIVDYVKNKVESIHSYKKIKLDIDCIEIDENLRYIVQGKGFRVVYDDFLKYNTLKNYDLIAMNPPFNNQEYHIKKALDMLMTSGGKLRAITSAEMIRNPYSNIRKEIINILNYNNATIEFYEEEFSDARRETDVEIAIIKCDIEKKEVGSLILDNLRQAELENEDTYRSSYIVENDFIKAIIKQYEFECKLTCNVITEYKQLEGFTKSDFEGNSNILSLRLSDDRNYSEPSENNLKNGALERIRKKYWTALFNNKEFTKLFTSNLQRDFYNKLDELKSYDFNEFNINEIRKQLNLQVVTGVEATILNLFNEFSRKHYWDKDSKNIHYYSGWKSNSCWKINKRIVIPLNGYGSWNDSYDPTYYQCIDKLSDIEKVFNYLDTGKTEELTLREILQQAKDNNQTKNVMTKFFKINFYRKGTAHLTFLDEELLKKFNIFGSQKHGFLPPSYGKKSYSQMSKEEQEVIDNFEGEKEYNKTVANKQYYIYNPNEVLMLV